MATGEALTLALASLAGSGVPGVSGHRLLVGEDRCLLFLPDDAPLGALLGGLAERLPDELEATGRHPAARLAVHAGLVGEVDAERAESDPQVRLTTAMLDSAEFRALLGNFPSIPPCASRPRRSACSAAGTASGSSPDGSYRARSPDRTAASCASSSPRTSTCPRTIPNCSCWRGCSTTSIRTGG